MWITWLISLILDKISYGNVNRKKKKDGTLYKDYFYYVCKHRRLVDGHKCGYRKQWSEEKINNAVEEVIRKLVKNPKFEEAILNKIASRIDTEELEKEIEGLEKQHRQLTGAKGRLGQQMDSLDIMDQFYEKKYQDMETRLYRLYDEIDNELCNLSKYCYAMKWGLTKRNYTKYTKKVTRT